MYEQDHDRGASVYIPPSYRGNALYFENPGQEEAPCGESEQKHASEQTRECDRECKKTSECRDPGLLGRLGGILNSDSAVVIAVLLFLLFSRRDRCDEQGDDMLTILLLALVLL